MSIPNEVIIRHCPLTNLTKADAVNIGLVLPYLTDCVCDILRLDSPAVSKSLFKRSWPKDKA